MKKNFLALPSKEFCKTVTIFVQFKCECECAYKLKNHTFCSQTHAVSVIFKLEKHNTRLFTQTVSQPRHLEYCGFLHCIRKVLNFILLEVMFYLTIMDFKIFESKYGRLLYSVSIWVCLGNRGQKRDMDPNNKIQS